MRILHIDTETTWRGGENQMNLLARGLRIKRGIEQHFALHAAGAALERIRSDFPTVGIPYRGGMDFRAASKICQYVDRYGIDLLHAHTSHSHSIALIAKFWRPELKVVVHRRVDYIPTAHPMNIFKYRTSRVDHYVAISQIVQKILIDFGISEHRISIARSAIDATPYQTALSVEVQQDLRRRWGVPGQLPLIVNASALTEQKGYNTLLSALAILKARLKPFYCLIAGTGPLHASLVQQITNLGLQEHVKLLGFIDDVPRLLQCADILAVPSNFEGLGTIVLEGLHAGCAVAATAVGGIPEMIRHEYNGLLSPKGDASAFADNLEQLLRSPDLCAQFRQRSVEVKQQFSLEQMIEGNLRVYRHLIPADR